MFQHAEWRQAPRHGITQPGLSHGYGPAPANSWHLLLSNAMSLCLTEAVSLHHLFFLFVLTAPWEQQERLCAVCSWECTSMDNKTAEIPWCLPPSEQIVPVPLLSLGFCGFFTKSFQNQLIVLKEIPWTGLKWQLSFHITCTKNLETLSEGKF